MAIPLVSHSLFLLQAACFIVLAAYPFTRSSTFARAMEGRASSNEILILILPFGGLSVFGSVIGIPPSVDRPLSEVLINVRDPGPMVAGLGAGLIGTAFGAT
jgi:phosphoserine phosphatase RsbU/P